MWPAAAEVHLARLVEALVAAACRYRRELTIGLAPVIAAGGVLAVAIADPPVAIPAAVLVLILAVRYRRALIGRAARTLAGARLERRWHAAIATSGLPCPPAIIGREALPNTGTRLHVQVTGRITIGDLHDAREPLRAGLRARRIRVHADPDDGSRGTVDVLYHDPFAGPPLPWPGPPQRITQPIRIAVNEAGEPVNLDLYHRHLLIGGQTGFGKTVLLNLLIAAGVHDPHCTVHLIDVAKRGAGLGRWEDQVATLAVTRDEALGLLYTLEAAMNAKWDELRQAKRWDGTSRDDPTVLLVIDELAPLLVGKDGKAVTVKLWELVSVSRAAGMNIVAVMQKPEGRIIDTNVRDLFSHRLAFRSSTQAMAETITGYPYPMVPSDYTKGVALLVVDDGEPSRVKCCMVDGP